MSLTAGAYTYGGEVESFQPCGSKHVYWFETDEASLIRLRAAALARSEAVRAPYSPILIRVDGAAGPQAQDGFAVHYDGLWRAQNVSLVALEIPEDCDLPGHSAQ